MNNDIIILAAGLGSRLGRSLPKSLTKLVDGRTIMQQQLENIKFGFNEKQKATIVVGFKASHIVEEYPDNSFVYNEQYDITNTSKSLLRAFQSTPKKNGALWMNGDVVFDPRLLHEAAILMEQNQSFVTVNTSRVSEEEIKYTVNSEGNIQLLAKTVPQEEALGEAVGINYVTAADKKTLIQYLKSVDDQDYFERGVELAIQKAGLLIKPMDISKDNYYAVEVDFADDLKTANTALSK